MKMAESTGSSYPGNDRQTCSRLIGLDGAGEYNLLLNKSGRQDT
jgi:hypothetical protein